MKEQKVSLLSFGIVGGYARGRTVELNVNRGRYLETVCFEGSETEEQQRLGQTVGSRRSLCPKGVYRRPSPGSYFRMRCLCLRCALPGGQSGRHIEQVVWLGNKK